MTGRFTVEGNFSDNSDSPRRLIWKCSKDDGRHVVFRRWVVDIISMNVGLLINELVIDSNFYVISLTKNKRFDG